MIYKTTAFLFLLLTFVIPPAICSDCKEFIGEEADNSPEAKAEADNYLQIYLYEFYTQSYQAYREEEPAIAIWALKKLAKILQKDLPFNISEERKEGLRKDLMLTYGRIALTYKKIENTEQYKEYITKCVNLANEVYGKNKTTYTEDYLVDMIKEIDINAIIRD